MILDIYLQAENPGKNKENNWLPVPKAEFNVLMRAYWANKSLLNGKWKPNVIKKIS